MLDHFLHTRWSDVMGRMNCAIYGDVKSVEKHFAARIILAFARFIIIRTNVFWILNNFCENETNAMHLKTEKNSGTEKKSESHRKLQFFYANLMSPASAVFPSFNQEKWLWIDGFVCLLFYGAVCMLRDFLSKLLLRFVKEFFLLFECLEKS